MDLENLNELYSDLEDQLTEPLMTLDTIIRIEKDGSWKQKLVKVKELIGEILI